MVIDPHTSKTSQLSILLTQQVVSLTNLEFALRQWQVVVAFEADALRYLGIEFVKTLHPNLVEHRLKVVISMRKIFVVHSLLFLFIVYGL